MAADTIVVSNSIRPPVRIEEVGSFRFSVEANDMTYSDDNALLMAIVDIH